MGKIARSLTAGFRCFAVELVLAETSSFARFQCKNEPVTKELVGAAVEIGDGIVVGFDVSGVDVAEVEVEPAELEELLELEEVEEDEPDVGMGSSVDKTRVRFSLALVSFRGECFSFGLTKAGR